MYRVWHTIQSMPCSQSIPNKGTRELRKGRFSGRYQIYHISTVTLERHPVFDSFTLARVVIQCLKREDDAAHSRTMAFVLMPDHLHWLFQLKGDKPLSTCVNNVKSLATRKINQISGRQGRLWQKGFHDRAIRKEEDLTSVARYIVANPLRAGLVNSVKDYPHWDAIWL